MKRLALLMVVVSVLLIRCQKQEQGFEFTIVNNTGESIREIYITDVSLIQTNIKYGIFCSYYFKMLVAWAPNEKSTFYVPYNINVYSLMFVPVENSGQSYRLYNLDSKNKDILVLQKENR